MWLGEQITEFGIGNGISIILFAGILSRGPSMIRTMYQASATIWTALPARESLICRVGHPADSHRHAGHRGSHCIHSECGAPHSRPVRQARCGPEDVRRPVQPHPSEGEHDRRYAIIFAQAIASLPATIAAFAGVSKNDPGFWGGFLRVFDTTSIFYIVVYFLLIVGFSFFYSTMQFNPVEVANNLKKNGGSSPASAPASPPPTLSTRCSIRSPCSARSTWRLSPSRPLSPAR